MTNFVLRVLTQWQVDDVKPNLTSRVGDIPRLATEEWSRKGSQTSIRILRSNVVFTVFHYNPVFTLLHTAHWASCRILILIGSKTKLQDIYSDYWVIDYVSVLLVPGCMECRKSSLVDTIWDAMQCALPAIHKNNTTEDLKQMAEMNAVHNEQCMLRIAFEMFI